MDVAKSRRYLPYALTLIVLSGCLYVLFFCQSEALDASKEWLPVNQAMKELLQFETNTAEAQQQKESAKAETESTRLNEEEAPNKALDKTEVPNPNTKSDSSVADKAADSAHTVGTNLLSINKATAEQLDALPGIGPSKAQAIVDYRNQLGGFNQLEQLMNVKGIGAKTFAKMKPMLSL